MGEIFYSSSWYLDENSQFRVARAWASSVGCDQKGGTPVSGCDQQVGDWLQSAQWVDVIGRANMNCSFFVPFVKLQVLRCQLQKIILILFLFFLISIAFGFLILCSYCLCCDMGFFDFINFMVNIAPLFLFFSGSLILMFFLNYLGFLLSVLILCYYANFLLNY